MKLSNALREMGENSAPAVELTVDTESLLTAADEIDALREALEDTRVDLMVLTAEKKLGRNQVMIRIQKRLRTVLDTTSL